MALTDNLVAYYKFDGNANDSVGSYNGTVSGATLTTGKINQAYNFDGNDYISIGKPVTNTFTISLWVKITEFPTTTAGGNIATLGGISATPSNNNYYYISTTNTGVVTAGNHVGGISSGVLSTDVWYHMVFMNSPSGCEFYVDGISKGTVGGQTSYLQGYCAIGNLRSQDDCVNGIIDEVGIWSRALTSDEISDLYNSGNGLSYPFINNNNFLTMSLGCEF